MEYKKFVLNLENDGKIHIESNSRVTELEAEELTQQGYEDAAPLTK